MYYVVTTQTTTNELIPYNWDKTNKTLLIYNRVPKCGSGTMLKIFDRLSVRNNFTLKGYLMYSRYKPTKEQEENAAQYVMTMPRPACLVKHFFYINFTEFNLPKPMYINMIREPVEMWISSYYFEQMVPSGYRQNPQNLNNITAEFVDCFSKGVSKCRVLHGAKEQKKLSIPYICGNQPFCLTIGSKEALQRAKYVAEKEYAIIGVLEEFNITLQLMEYFLPEYFRGALKIQTEDRRNAKSHMVDRSKVEDKLTEIKSELRKNLTLEYEFYYFVKQRLFWQYDIMKNIYIKS
ncbi:Heparan sulfate 2-O-sulfotransferase pipe [Nymphon striatum]|nr:Heparan sulfate 2-O-sulfotransferase pipe [Nymphon striatum]